MSQNSLFLLEQLVIEHSHLSGEVFNLYLHQNYLDFFSEVEDVDKATEYLSDADLLTADWMVSLFWDVQTNNSLSTNCTTSGVVLINIKMHLDWNLKWIINRSW